MLSFSVPDSLEDLLICGVLEFYDHSFDRANPKNKRRLEHFKTRNFFKVTTTDDPVICRLVTDATAIAIDAILSALMCAPRSVYSSSSSASATCSSTNATGLSLTSSLLTRPRRSCSRTPRRASTPLGL
ncbi:eukaryotic translation initiation factor [Canna indica]|uniref:Eukaryotic translation initiation factor n=1 Tax=Canna indica TaxID=4628 RepID=A0AAQ3QAW4_9LILI|nr:eukaryotic translation initiation factor [Canna indica]